MAACYLLGMSWKITSIGGAVHMGETAEDAVIKCLGLPLTPWYSEDEVVYPGAQECLAGLRDKYSIIAENQNIE